MWVKICGNTTLQDAQLAARLGADAVGFVFAPSPRQVTASQVALITPHLSPHVERVGVFHSRDAAQIEAIARTSNLTAVQLHGGFDEQLARQLEDRFAGSVRIIQTLHWTVGQPAPDQANQPAQSPTSQLAGMVFDWAAASATFSSAPDGIHLIVAGGLNPQNVALAIAQLGPWGVDVSSGVEASPGRKDPLLLARFIENARAAASP
jgi:phosphoribosylanthranilate isomerase